MPALNGLCAGSPGLLARIMDADPASMMPAPREARGAVTSR